MILGGNLSAGFLFFRSPIERETLVACGYAKKNKQVGNFILHSFLECATFTAGLLELLGVEWAGWEATIDGPLIGFPWFGWLATRVNRILTQLPHLMAD